MGGRSSIPYSLSRLHMDIMQGKSPPGHGCTAGPLPPPSTTILPARNTVPVRGNRPLCTLLHPGLHVRLHGKPYQKPFPDHSVGSIPGSVTGTIIHPPFQFFTCQILDTALLLHALVPAVDNAETPLHGISGTAGHLFRTHEADA